MAARHVHTTVRLFLPALVLGLLYAGGDRATASEGRWVPLKFPGVSPRAIAIDPQTTSTIYAGGSRSRSGSLHRSVDAGVTWAPVHAGLTTSSAVMSLAIDPQTQSRIYAGTTNGVFRSVDAGANWVHAGLDFKGASIGSLAIDPQTPSTIYAGTTAGRGLFRSTDAGASWTAIHSWVPGGSTVRLVIDPQTPSTLYAGVAQGPVTQPAPLTGVFRSTNGGASWTAVNAGLPGSAPHVLALAIDPQSPSTLYAGVGVTARVYRSTNAGASWIAVGSGLPATAGVIRALVVSPETPSILYVATSEGGVYRSVDSGETMTAFNTGFPFLWITALAMDPVIPSILYASIDPGGLFRWQPK